MKLPVASVFYEYIVQNVHSM